MAWFQGFEDILAIVGLVGITVTCIVLKVEYAKDLVIFTAGALAGVIRMRSTNGGTAK